MILKMNAVIVEIHDKRLLVRDEHTNQEYVVNLKRNRKFSIGDKLVIHYGEAMTLSLPPHISAVRIRKIQDKRKGDINEI